MNKKVANCYNSVVTILKCSHTHLWDSDVHIFAARMKTTGAIWNTFGRWASMLSGKQHTKKIRTHFKFINYLIIYCIDVQFTYSSNKTWAVQALSPLICHTHLCTRVCLILWKERFFRKKDFYSNDASTPKKSCISYLKYEQICSCIYYVCCNYLYLTV